ncbi:sensor histidine kinase [Nonomuraea gerenzanensis]|uniref:histidine kinase n=1 Tax=Nonomuraea gerenzanensis TaxID=93944 RepID=A0A1M4E5E6_9ACTN|nr:nitrate- and nitrite sensing domain-containing protein [Nonomuraea gerenzanensis]UBU16202.1 nitrate- and nitrite sensing domain-containing protein [Nonomuraea gerenzanensis]SBO94013.1 sensor-like histidine kinase [Nonomuraea gerenzanensis]
MSSPPPLRTKLLRILLLPLVSMVTLWGFIAYSSVDEITTVSQIQNRWESIGAPVLQLIVELQKERQLSAQAPDGTATYKPLTEQRLVTDNQVKRLREIISTLDVDAVGETPAQVQAMVQALDGLQSLRASADGGVLAPALTIVEAYNNLIAVANQQFTDRDAMSDASAYQSVRGMTAYSTSAEYLWREHAVLTTTIVQRNMTPTDRAAFVAAMTARRLALANAERDASPELRAAYDRLVSSDAYKRVVAVEDELFSYDTGGPPPVSATTWRGDAETVLTQINRDTQTELVRAAVSGEAQKNGAYWRIGAVLLLGLTLVILSLWLSYRFGQSLIAELRRLQGSAVELAEERLPRLVERLRRGDDVDPATEAPGLDRAETAEVDRVVHAFSAVRRTAVEAAVGQATLRKGVAQVFLNLARRNQALLHRQLALLDTMERRADEPEVLEDLFKLDHLTTRMRRHAENLIILSGSSPARRWRDPVPLFDVVRAAVLEVEDYTRVTVAPMPSSPLLVGAAVTDVIHLVAELVENAAVFSPPNTTVQVRGVTAANGMALEVEDRGLGLNDATLNELNARLADVPEFDLADSDRLGLFVVARLAARHGIKIVLRRSPYDGTTAIVLLPATLLADAEPLALTAGTAAGSGTVTGSMTGSVTGSVAGSVTGSVTGAVNGRATRPVRGTWFEPDPAQNRTDPGFPQDFPPSGPVPDFPPSVPEFPPSLPMREPVQDDGPAPVSGTAFPPGSDLPDPDPVIRFGNGPATTSGPPTGWSVTVPPQEADEDLDGLPMRIPQASLAPQLRVDARPERRGAGGRSPEELAQLMSSMQRGWQEGRQQAKQEPDMWNRKDDQPDA